MVKAKLRRELGLLHVVMLCVGAIVGTGIFIIPGIAAGLLGPGSLLLWIGVGLLTIPISLCFIELAGMYTHTGGPYLFVKDALGDFWGFLTGWTAWILACVTMGTQAIAVYYYLNYFIPLTYWQGMLVCFLTIAVFTLVNYMGVKHGGRTQLILTVGTFSVLFIFIILGLPHVNLSNFTPLFPLGLSMLGMTAVLILEPFIGWETITTIAGEVKNARRNIPLGLIISTILIILFYSLVVFTALGVLNWKILGASTSPLADVMWFAYGGFIGALMAVGAIVVKLACLNSWILTTARLPYAMARDKLFLQSFKSINKKYGTPGKPLLIQAIFAFSVALSGSFKGAILLLMVNALILYILCSLSVIKLKTSPRKRRFDFPVILPVIALLTCIIFFTQIPLQLIFAGLSLLVFGIPIYVLIKLQYDKRFVERFYDTFSPLYDLLSPLWYGKEKREKVIEGAEVKKSNIVLDYGCATGANVIKLAELVGKRGKVVAVDIAIKQLERSVRKTERVAGLPNVIFIKEEEEIPFEPKTFNAIVSVGVLSYQEKPEKLLNKFREILKPNGKLSILDFGRVLFFPPPKHLRSKQSIKRTFKKAGFKKINIEKRKGLFCEYYYIKAKK